MTKKGVQMSHNDVTGDRLASRPNTKKYEENYDRIFRKKVEPGYNEVKQDEKKEQKNENTK
jgi:hypothetical protein